MIDAVRDARGISHYALPHPIDLVVMLDETIARVSTKDAFVDRGRALTWREFGAGVEALAERLSGSGVTSGDRVALLAGNGVPFSTAAFAVWRLGGVLVPLNHRLTSGDLGALLADSGARILLIGSAHEELGRAAAPGDLPVAIADDDGVFLSTAPVGALPSRSPGSDAAAAIMYTSGTTGRPKGVVITHANALENSGTCTAVIGRTEADRELIMVPQFNITGLCSQTIPAVQLGMTSILFGAFDAAAALDAIERFGATSTVGAPTMWWRLLDTAETTGSSALGGLRLALFGGAPMPTALLARMREAMPSATFGNGYGQTETCSMVTYIGGQEALLRPDSVGRALPITDVRIVDPQTRVPVADGEPGELLVRGGQISAGYWDAGTVRPIADADGWVSTGDAALLDDGFVVLRDRLKDVIKRGGESVFSFEVEDCLAQHPDVMEVAVVGLPDEQFGEIVAAAVVARPGTVLDDPTLRAHCASHLARFKVPRHFEVLPELPRNAGGKVLKNELRALLSSTPTMSDQSTKE